MKTIEKIATVEDFEFELEDNYDFSDGIRGRFYVAEKTTETVQLDSDILQFLKMQAIEKHTDYQTVLNTLLRDCMNKIPTPTHGN
jgi:uncharacterized protein (DUF4415 family)